MANQKQGGSYGSGQGSGQGSYGGYPMQGMQQGMQGQPMMYPYYQNQMGMGQMPPGSQSGQQLPPSQNGGNLPLEEESYIENILRLNKGKQATVYMTFENNEDWNAKIFKGIIEAAGRDHIVLSDPETGLRYLLLMVYLDYITFPEEINYAYPYGGNRR
ncbi:MULTISPECIES: spore coat protein GerQ [Pontibacillus]|uniref:Spore coat protein GerQ n=1 Tax=Pontibacillus chungwhensis TaxID=265426 RepID=A0ABY8UXA4_9BACI|nr:MULTISPECIES: spore coat protein GerQ [Pontibacillus]MCD5324010.1 spore coat protein GerQ [Pontibacillus sp. HN14]WIF97928.1 spore coat protein GerQ [Pontibacillus chungwhensis]